MTSSFLWRTFLYRGSLKDILAIENLYKIFWNIMDLLDIKDFCKALRLKKIIIRFFGYNNSLKRLLLKEDLEKTFRVSKTSRSPTSYRRSL